MTREEAINLYWNARYNLANEKQKAALDVAFAALREREERSKGCDWCEKDRVLCWDSGGEEVCIANKGKLPVLGTDDWGFAIKFCPMCGRRLEEV